jgi:hypothetical protein
LTGGQTSATGTIVLGSLPKCGQSRRTVTVVPTYFV